MWGDAVGINLTVQSSGSGPGGVIQTVVTDYTSAVRSVDIATNRMDTPGKMTFATVEGSSRDIPEGSLVEFTAGGTGMFKGYIFSAEHSRDGQVKYTAYDQLRYLKASASYVFENMTLGQIVQRIAADFGLKTGSLADTGYVFPCLIREDESCLDIIFDALSQTIIQTGKIWLFYDDFGALTLVEAKDRFVRTLLGDRSLVTDYTYRRDIDSDTYNRIKLVRKNSGTGRTDVYLHEDSENIRKWGLLQYYGQVDENLNEAQIDAMCAMYLQYYNRVLKTITLESLGVAAVRAGSVLPVRIGAVGDLAVTRLLLAEKVTHTFEGEDHTMKIEVRSFDQLGGVSVV